MNDVFDLPHLITDVVADLQPAAEDKGVHVAAHGVATMPHWVEGDAPALRRMLLNTLDLVVGAATDGRVILRLDPHASGPDRWICVVAWRAAGEEPDRPIQEVKSAFIVTLRSSGSTATVGPFRILVVDDSAQHRAMVAAYLDGTAHVVTEAESGEDAIRRVGAGVFDVILMDVQMPGMGGIEAIGVIRAYESTLQQPPAYIIALSTMGAHDDEAESTLAGADLCLPKPLGRDELFRALSAVPAAEVPEQPGVLSEQPGFSPADTVGLEPDGSENDGPEYLPIGGALSTPQLLAVTRHQLHSILQGPAGTQVERLRQVGQTLKTTAADAGLADIAHLATALEEICGTGSLADAQTAARSLQAWVLRTSPT